MRNTIIKSELARRAWLVIVLPAVLAVTALVIACGGTTETVVQTVVVEKAVPGETVIQTVVVEKEVEVAGETIVQTVVVEREVKGETVVQTVVIEKQVQVSGETVVQTVVVEKEVEKEVIREVDREVQVVVTATPAPAVAAPPPAFQGNLRLGEILVDPPVFLPSKQGTGNMQLLIFWGFFEPLMWAKHSAPPSLNLDASTYTDGVVG